MSNHNKVFTFSGLISVIVAYLVLLVTLIIIFNIFHFATSLFIGLLCALTVICAIIALIVYLSSRHVARTDQRTKEKLDKGEYKAPKRGGF